MRALVTGATGQDGQYLCELLLEKGYEVHALHRTSTTRRLPDLNVNWYDGDMMDGERLRAIVHSVEPDEIYNLAAQSHVGMSFEQPGLTMRVNALAVTELLEAVRWNGNKFYQASTSEMFGSSPPMQGEETMFRPRSPYGVSKLAAYWMTVNYREGHDLYACNGILFNHESPRRGEQFVTRKITRAVAGFTNGRTKPLRLGNLDARRDWGHARDYVLGMWQIMQQPQPADYVLATGETRTVREFVEAAFECIGHTIEWIGIGEQEYGIDNNNRVVVTVDPQLYRPTEVDVLCGDAGKARSIGWEPKTSFRDLVQEMVITDITEGWHEPIRPAR